MSDDLRNRVARAIAKHHTIPWENMPEARKNRLLAYADAALAEMGGVRVKPLVWWQSDTGDWCANCELGRYHIGAETGGTWRLDYAFRKKFDTKKPRSFIHLVDAKAAAQADYEARILAALE